MRTSSHSVSKAITMELLFIEIFGIKKSSLLNIKFIDILLFFDIIMNFDIDLLLMICAGIL